MFEMTVRIGYSIPSDIWSVGKESIAMFELATWQASFPDIFIILQRYTFIGKQLSNDTTFHPPLFSLVSTFKLKKKKKLVCHAMSEASLYSSSTVNCKIDPSRKIFSPSEM
jgi:hypothetical protein